MTVEFTITISGSGKTIDDCWNDATDGFSLDPGVTPEDNYEITGQDEDEEEAP